MKPIIVAASSTVLLLTATRDDAATMIGFMGSCSSILLACSPLAAIRSILATKNAGVLVREVAQSGVLVAISWFAYGYLIDNFIVMAPNVFSLSSALIQLGLIRLYPSGKKDDLEIDQDDLDIDRDDVQV